mmetsp:Transcript_21981/g.86319  ORF Transcript_21981/g.86319 Transcript_21981/m.86319 type:complete len:280 (+) Transcript_21981:941-1780(+)
MLPKALTQAVRVQVEHHHDEQEQHHDGADVDQHQRDRQELGLQQHPEAGGGEERQDQEQRGVHGVARRDDTERRHQQDAGENVEEDGRDVHAYPGQAAGPCVGLRRRRSAVLGVRLLLGRDLGLVLVANGQQHVLGEVQVAALLAVVFEDAGLDDGVHRAALFAEAAEDALGQVDVVTRRAAAAVAAHIAFDRDCHGGADRLAELAGNAALLAVLVAAQRMQATKARRQRRLLFRELDSHVARQEMAPGQLHPLEQLPEEEGLREIRDCSHGRCLTSRC